MSFRAARAACAVCLVIALLPLLGGCGEDRAVGSSAVEVSVSVDASRLGAPVPRDFLGLSFEMSSLAQVARYADGGDFATMLRSLGHGVLRFGGVSADTRVAWTDGATPLAPWASSAVQVSDLLKLRKLAADSGWRVLLTIGLAQYNPLAAAREALAARRALRGWLAGIELGNEPDAYARHHLRSSPWTFSRYGTQIAAYRRAIEKVAPGIAFVGPDVSGSHVFEDWGRRAAISERPALLTGHHYPLGCHTLPPATIARLLSPGIRRAEDASLHRYMAVSRASGIRFRLDEANTVSCGGKAGVSNTFASTLWAVDYIARAMAAGAAGVNLQGNPANCHGYTPVCATTPQKVAEGDLTAQPEWYALLLSKALVGDHPVRVRASPSPANVDVIASLSARRELHMVIVDDDPPGARPALVTLHVGRRFGSAVVLSLTAPSPAATAGVLLGGRAVDGDGRWRAPANLPRRPGRSGVVTLDVLPSSAMLVTLAPRRRPAQAPPG